MNPTPRRSGWKLWVGVCAAFGLPLLGLGLWIWSAGERRWEELRADGQRLVQEAKQRDGSREVLRGEPIPGRAWEDYNAAITLLKPAGKLSELSGFVAQKPEVDRARVLADLEKCAPAVERFRRGGRRTDGQHPWDWNRFPEEAMVSLVHALRLTDFMLAQARVDAESGRGRIGAELALDVVRFWQDCSFNVIPLGTSISIAGARQGLDLVRWELTKGILKPEDFQELERQLEVLDRTMPIFGPALKNNQAFMARLLVDVGAFDYAGHLGGPRWRYGFSPKLQVADWYSQLDRDTKRLADCDRMSWQEERAAWASLESDRGVAGVPPELASAVVFKSFSSNLRQMRARVRLLRLALHRKSTGAWLDLGDPFGDRLRHEETATQLKAWSLGPDGVDLQGRGTWDCVEKHNLVLEVPR